MHRISLKNYRCFREQQSARLAPLTLLVGENSTGKTSFMAMIRTLWEMAIRGGAPDFKSPPYDLGSFDEIAHHRGGRGSRADTFTAAIDVSTRNEKKLDHKGNSGFLSYEVTFAKEGSVPTPERVRLSREDLWVEYAHSKIRFGTDRGSWEIAGDDANSFMENMEFYPFFYMAHVIRLAYSSEELKFVSVSGSNDPIHSDIAKVLEIMVPISNTQVRRPRTPYASAPVRSKPRRVYEPALITPDTEGDYIPMYLSSLYFEGKQKWDFVKARLEEFGRSAGLFDEISVRPLGKKQTEPFQLQLRKFGTGLKGPHRNLIDVGYGVSQVLPVITELLHDDVAPLVLLQQPEVHLHPSAQAELGSLFCKIAGSDRQLIVETHSDNLLDRVRMDVRDRVGNLKPEDVSVLFFERNGLDVKIHSLEIDAEGNILNSPQGYRKFFMEETSRSLIGRN